ncbi:hypothetical protein RUND412_002628 [Rhizina undulata]
MNLNPTPQIRSGLSSTEDDGHGRIRVPSHNVAMNFNTAAQRQAGTSTAYQEHRRIITTPSHQSEIISNKAPQDPFWVSVAEAELQRRVMFRVQQEGLEMGTAEQAGIIREHRHDLQRNSPPMSFYSSSALYMDANNNNSNNLPPGGNYFRVNENDYEGGNSNLKETSHEIPSAPRDPLFDGHELTWKYIYYSQHMGEGLYGLYISAYENGERNMAFDMWFPAFDVNNAISRPGATTPPPVDPIEEGKPIPPGEGIMGIRHPKPVPELNFHTLVNKGNCLRNKSVLLSEKIGAIRPPGVSFGLNLLEMEKNPKPRRPLNQNDYMMPARGDNLNRNQNSRPIGGHLNGQASSMGYPREYLREHYGMHYATNGMPYSSSEMPHSSGGILHASSGMPNATGMPYSSGSTPYLSSHMPNTVNGIHYPSSGMPYPADGMFFPAGNVPHASSSRIFTPNRMPYTYASSSGAHYGASGAHHGASEVHHGASGLMPYSYPADTMFYPNSGIPYASGYITTEC